MGQMPEACVAAQRASQAIDSTLDRPKSAKERTAYYGFMRRDDVPAHASPTLEIEWLAFSLSVKEPDYNTAPSKVAATWLRRMRLKGAERTRFWNEMWPYFMENRVALELKSANPLPSKKKAVKGAKSDEDVQAGIEKMSQK